MDIVSGAFNSTGSSLAEAAHLNSCKEDVLTDLGIAPKEPRLLQFDRLVKHEEAEWLGEPKETLSKCCSNVSKMDVLNTRLPMNLQETHHPPSI